MSISGLPIEMPPAAVHETEDLSSIDDSLASSQSSAIPAKPQQKPSSITHLQPASDFSARQSAHLVERICQDHGIEAPRYTFARSLCANHDRALHWSSTKHESLLKLADYLSRRAGVEAEYAQALQKLNRQTIQYAEADERFSQVLVMAEKTATGHADFARKITTERVPEELRTLCHEHEAHRKALQSEIKAQQEAWKRAIVAFERIRKSKERAQAAADAAQLAVHRAAGTGGVAHRRRLEADCEEKLRRAALAREDYSHAASALLSKKKEIFGDQLPRLLDSLERMERARIGALRAVLVGLAQGQLAFAEIEVEGGERWLRAVVAEGVDEEIETFIRSGPHGDLDLGLDEEHGRDDGMKSSMDNTSTNSTNAQSSTTLTSNTTHTTSVVPDDLLADSWNDLKQQKDALTASLQKLEIQLAGLHKMHASFHGQAESQAAVQQGLEVVQGEIERSSALLKAVEEKMGRVPRELELPLTNSGNPLSPIRSALKMLGEIGTGVTGGKGNALDTIADATTAAVPAIPKQRKKALSKSFEEILSIGEMGLAEAALVDESVLERDVPVVEREDTASSKLPGMQWSRSRSNSAIAMVDDSMIEESVSINASTSTTSNLTNQSTLFAQSSLENVFNSRRAFRCELDASELASRRQSLKEESKEAMKKNLEELFSSQQQQRIVDEKEPVEPLTLNEHEPVDLRPKWKEMIEGKSDRGASDLNGKGASDLIGKGASTVNSNIASTIQSTVNATIQSSTIQSTQSTTSTAKALFKVQALYPFKGEPDNDELDLKTGEVLAVLDAEGEWWMAENEGGVRGYIPFNYVIKLQ